MSSFWDKVWQEFILITGGFGSLTLEGYRNDLVRYLKSNMVLQTYVVKLKPEQYFAGNSYEIQRLIHFHKIDP